MSKKGCLIISDSLFYFYYNCLIIFFEQPAKTIELQLGSIR